MSSFATTWAWNQKAGKAKAVLLALVEFADSEGICRVPQTHLAAMTEQSEKTIQRHLQELEVRDLIKRFEVRAPDGAQMLDEIHLMSRRAWHSGRIAQPSVQGGDILTGGAEMGPDKMTAIISKNSSLDTSIKNNNTSIEANESDHRTTDVGAGPSNTELRIPTTSPDGAASGEARQAAPSQDGLENAHQDGGNVNVTGSENVPPAATPFRAALNAIETAGLTPTWVQWIKLNRLAQVSQEAQIVVWQGWIEAGLGETLKTAAADIVESGSFAHPWGGLKARMQKAQAAQTVQQQVAATFGEPAISPGQRRIAPDGRIWTVEVVEFGTCSSRKSARPPTSANGSSPAGVWSPSVDNAMRRAYCAIARVRRSLCSAASCSTRTLCPAPSSVSWL